VCNAGKPKEHFIGDRYFELPELKLLVDAVRASRFISQRKADALISKLAATATPSGRRTAPLPVHGYSGAAGRR